MSKPDKNACCGLRYSFPFFGAFYKSFMFCAKVVKRMLSSGSRARGSPYLLNYYFMYCLNISINIFVISASLAVMFSSLLSSKNFLSSFFHLFLFLFFVSFVYVDPASPGPPEAPLY